MGATRFKDLKTKNEKISWILERLSESQTGKMLIRDDLTCKYRTITGDTKSSKEKIKNIIIDEYNRALRDSAGKY